MACCVSKSRFCQDIPQSPHLFLESHSLPYRLVALYTYPENKEESPHHILRASSCGSAFLGCRSLSHALPKLQGSCAPVLAVCEYNACLGPWKMFPPGLRLVENIPPLAPGSRLALLFRCSVREIHPVPPRGGGLSELAAESLAWRAHLTL